jgi:hypothetical protein
MKKLLTITWVILCGMNAMAQRFEPAKLIFMDGKTLVGFAKSPKQAYDKTISFKATENGDKQTFQSEQLKTVILYSNKDTLEIERVKIYNMTGKKIVSTPAWLQVLSRGYVTLYYYGIQGKTISYGSTTRTELPERWWLCIRPGEEAAKIVSYAYGLNPNTYFRQNAPAYFSDHPTIPEMIKNKDYKYDDIRIVVNEYNKWKSK